MYIEEIARLLEENPGEKEIIVPTETVIGFTREMREGYEAGRELIEQRRAVVNGNLQPRLIDMMAGFWRDVIAPPNMKGSSQKGLEALIRDAIGAARAMVPSTVASPSDISMQMVMLAILGTIRDYLRA